MRRSFLNILIVVFLTLLIHGGFKSSSYAEQAAMITFYSDHIDVTASVSGVTFMMVRISDPQGRLIFDQSSDGSPIRWYPPVGAQDGIYTYEARVGFSKEDTERDEAHQPPVRPFTQSGTLFIRDGAIMPRSERETGLLREISAVARTAFQRLMDFLVPPAFADILHLDDVIINGGSLCVGFDGANGEAFGLDTLRLKENNLRIHFEDTSTTAGFPSNDWRIIINDSANGGSSYFAVEDSTAGTKPLYIKAGAPNSALYVDDFGRIGLGTAIPAVAVHAINSDSPALRLEQDGTGGFTPQTWDMAGNQTNFFIRDVTNGNTLPFKIEPGAPTDSVNIKSDGKVGIGTSEPTEKLHVTGNAIISGNLELGSSRDYKNNILPLEAKEAIETMKALRPVRFNYKCNPSEESVGFIAEELPGLVATKGKKTLNPVDVVAVLARVIQEQQKTIEELSRKVGDLEKEEVKANYEER